MKKLFLFALMSLIALSMNAQRCAVLEFKAGSGISQADVDGISAIFITYFRPAGYTMVERTQIDKAIDEQGFQRSRMTENQIVRIGQILNVSKIVIGDVNVVMGQYNVDVRVINVETGTIAARAGDAFTASSYRSTMQKIAQQLAGQIAISSGPTVSAKSGVSSSTTSPIDKKKAAARSKLSSLEYVDLGLPSGTLWANAHHWYVITDKYSLEGLVLPGLEKDYPSEIRPSSEQFNELYDCCERTWDGSKCTFIGPNGNTFTLDMGDNENEYFYFTDGETGVYFKANSKLETNVYGFVDVNYAGGVCCVK